MGGISWSGVDISCSKEGDGDVLAPSSLGSGSIAGASLGGRLTTLGTGFSLIPSISDGVSSDIILCSLVLSVSGNDSSVGCSTVGVNSSPLSTLMDLMDTGCLSK